jgi:metallophosphoesterase superfamily enzyme
MADATRVILPAFGAYAGGLSVRDPALARLFPDGFTAWLTAATRVSAIHSTHLAR